LGWDDSERELQEVIETIPVMAWSAAADGAVEFFNRRWWSTLAYPQIKYKAGVGQVRFIRMI
jgi:hypothetical protein